MKVNNVPKELRRKDPRSIYQRLSDELLERRRNPSLDEVFHRRHGPRPIQATWTNHDPNEIPDPPGTEPIPPYQVRRERVALHGRFGYGERIYWSDGSVSATYVEDYNNRQATNGMFNTTTNNTRTANDATIH